MQNEKPMEVKETHTQVGNNVTTVITGHSVYVWEYYEWYHERWDPVYFRKMIDIRYGPGDNWATMTLTRANSTGD